MIIKHFIRFILISNLVSASPLKADSDADFLKFSKVKVNSAIEKNTIWDGPITGPKLATNKRIIFIASDLRNGGVQGVAKGITEAVSHIDWHLKFIDGKGSNLRQAAGLIKAINSNPDAIILGGIDAVSHKGILKHAQARGIVIIGWHATDQSTNESDLGLFVNITTDPEDVAEVAALLAIVESNGKANVIIFNDPNYKIATLKAEAMANIINRCKKCNLLALQELPLDRIAQEMPKTFDKLWDEHGDKLTHLLTINDLYFDFAIPSLESKRNNNKVIPRNISAGDGSMAAYKRISENVFQFATVPEPLYLHGWQLIDEMNRSFNNKLPSGYSSPVHLITPKNVNSFSKLKEVGIYDPENNYREAYLKIWKGL